MNQILKNCVFYGAESSWRAALFSRTFRGQSGNHIVS